MGKYMTSSLLLQGRIRGVYDLDEPIIDLTTTTTAAPLIKLESGSYNGVALEWYQGGILQVAFKNSAVFSNIFYSGAYSFGQYMVTNGRLQQLVDFIGLFLPAARGSQFHIADEQYVVNGTFTDYGETSTGVPTLYIQNDGDPATGSNSWMRMYVDSGGNGHIEGGGPTSNNMYINYPYIHVVRNIYANSAFGFADSLTQYGGVIHSISSGSQRVNSLCIGAQVYGWHLMRMADATTQPTAVPDQENALYFWPADGGTKYLRIYTDSADVGHIGGTALKLSIDRYLNLNHTSWDWDSRIFGYHVNTPTIGFHNNSDHQIHFVDSDNLYTDYSETDQGVPTIYLHNDGTPTGGDDAWVRWKVNSSGNAYIEHGGTLAGSLMYSGFSRVTFDGMLYASSIYSTPGATAYGGIEFSRSSYPYARLYLGTNTYGWHIMRYADAGTQPAAVPDQENALYFWPNNGGTFYGRIYVDSTQKFYIQAPANGLHINGSVSILGGSWGLSMSRIMFYAGGTSGADARATFAFGANSDNQLHLTPSAYRASSAYHEADLGVPTLYIQNDGDPASGANSWMRMYVASSGAKTIEGSSTSGHLYIKNGSNFIYLQAGAFYVPKTCYGMSYSQQGGIVGTQLTTAWVNTLMTGYATSGAGAGYGWHIAANYNPPDAIPNDYHASFYIWPDDNSNHYTRFYTTTAGDGYIETNGGNLVLGYKKYVSIDSTGGITFDRGTDSAAPGLSIKTNSSSSTSLFTIQTGATLILKEYYGNFYASNNFIVNGFQFGSGTWDRGTYLLGSAGAAGIRHSGYYSTINQFHYIHRGYNLADYVETDLGVPTLYIQNDGDPATASNSWMRFYVDSSNGYAHWESTSGHFYIYASGGGAGILHVGQIQSNNTIIGSYLKSASGSSYGGALYCPNDVGSPPTPHYNNSIQFTVDESAGSNQLTVSVRYSDGTVKTATLTLS